MHLATSSSIGFWLAKKGFEAVNRSRKLKGRFSGQAPKLEAVSYLLIRVGDIIQVEIASTKLQAEIVMANSCCQSMVAVADIVGVVRFEATAE